MLTESTGREQGEERNLEQGQEEVREEEQGQVHGGYEDRHKSEYRNGSKRRTISSKGNR
jgi:hypothetical protein